MERLQVYKCSVCGNIVELVHVGGGPLSCCGQLMVLQKPGITDGATEKHVPVIEKKDGGYLVRVGEQPHPMVEAHHIEWIEIITKDRVFRKFLNPGDKPEAFFEGIEDDHFTVREYCNIHGLWKNEQ